MSNRGCNTCASLGTSKHEYPCNECTNNRATDHYKPMTNADRIRNMTDEELADLLVNDAYCDEIASANGCIPSCRECTLKWLQAEVKEGE